MKKSVPTESFFNFFSPPKPPTEEDDDAEDDAASDIEERLELDYQLGEDIKEKLIPRAVDWFTGEALAFEELSDDDDLEDDFEEEEDDEEDDLSDDHDDEEETEDEASPVLSFSKACLLTESSRMNPASPSKRPPSASRAEDIIPRARDSDEQ